MKFSQDLKQIKSNYQFKLRTILDFINEIDVYIEKNLNGIKGTVLTSDANTESEGKKLRDFLIEALDENSNSKANERVEVASPVLSKFILVFIKSMRYSEFLNEMTLSYLIACQEAMFKDYLHSILINNNNCLKTAKDKISYDEILSFDNMEDLIESIVKKVVDSIGYGSAEDIFKFYLEKFNIDFKSFHGWELIIESSLRRNLVIHNKSIANDSYCRKFSEISLNDRIDVDSEYVKSVAENLIEFNEFCLSAVSQKFRIET